MTTYSRRQLVLLLGLVVAAGAGLAIGEWRRANPELAATIESIDRLPEDDRPVTSVARSQTVRVAPSPIPARAARGDGASRREPLDLNRASAEELTRLPGIGPVLAARIVAARETNGPFASVDDLRRVSGLGPAKLAAFRDLVTASR